MEKSFHALIFEESLWHVAQCLEIDIASQGNTAEEAFQNLQEALDLHLQVPCNAGLSGYDPSCDPFSRLRADHCLHRSWLVRAEES